MNKEIAPIAEAGNEELDEEKIRRLFVETSSDKIELLANQVARPDGFAKTLILGSIATSEELQKSIGVEFVKTHRGYYWRSPPTHSEGGNDYLSFNVGKPQRIYQESSHKRLRKNWQGGLGYSLLAKPLLERENVSPSWGSFNLYYTVLTCTIQFNS